jgi:transcriptional regulator with XRE-family HTH domain
MVPDVLKSIRLARIERNHSQEFIATKLNLTQSYYAKIERGSAKLTIELFFRLLNILEIDYVAFFKEIKKKKPIQYKCDYCQSKRNQ